MSLFTLHSAPIHASLVMCHPDWDRVCACVSHRCGQPGGQSHLQVSLEAEQSRNQDEDLCDELERLPVLQMTHRGDYCTTSDNQIQTLCYDLDTCVPVTQKMG